MNQTQAKSYLIEAWFAANDRSIRIPLVLAELGVYLSANGYRKLVNEHFHSWDSFAKWQLVCASIILGVDYEKIDDKKWYINGFGKPPMSVEDRAEEIRQAQIAVSQFSPD